MTTFENGFNGFTQSDSDQFDWSLSQFQTPTSGTGPLADHTSGTGEMLLTTTNSIQLRNLHFPIVKRT